MKRAAKVPSVAGLGIATLAFTLLGCPKPPVEAVAEHWCPEGFEPGHGDVCFALPAEHGPTTGIVVYLHGMLEGHGSPAEWTAARSAVSRGFAVVLPRGRRGLCDWKPELKDHFCWPQDSADTAEMKALVALWDRTLWQVNELLDGGTHPRFVLGFSNGAFFANHLARSGTFKADAYALVGGGAAPTEAATAESHPPMLLLAASQDAYQGPAMKGLQELFAREKWPSQRCTRPGEHSLTTEDVGAALRFFRHEPVAPSGSFACDGQLAVDPKAPDKGKKKGK